MQYKRLNAWNVGLAVVLLWGVLLACACQAQDRGITQPYTDPKQFTTVPFGSRSDYWQPWRGYTETTPASTFLNGVGVNIGSGDITALASQFGSHGFRCARVEVGWGNIDYDDPTKLDNAADLTAQLLALKAAGIRPTILLNGNSGQPCPTHYDNIVLAAPVKVGDTSMSLLDTSGVIPGRTGLINLTGYVASRPMFTALSGPVVTLSQPCPVAYGFAQTVQVTTLRYEPFTTPGTQAYNDTVTGWQQYVLTVAKLARSALGVGGFDLEVWNELTFGSDFLDAANYGLPASQTMWGPLVSITAAVAASDPADFKGVGIGDGFANTIPWPASGDMPPQITAIDKHPYHDAVTVGAASVSGTTLNALGKPDSFVPSYVADLPEYFGTFIQTETVLRDASPFVDSSFSYAGIHGRNVRPGNPCPVWITEYSSGGTPEQIRKRIMRAMCFYLNKGVTRLEWFNTDGLQGANSIALDAVKSLSDNFSAGLDASAKPRSITLNSVANLSGNLQYKGDGTPANPNLRDSDVFAFLPYQVNAHRFVVPFYVMTRDASKDLPEEGFNLSVSGFTSPVKVSAIDPVSGQTEPVNVQWLIGGTVIFRVQATDTPRLLVFDDE
jgi:hypothetical protein